MNVDGVKLVTSSSMYNPKSKGWAKDLDRGEHSPKVRWPVPFSSVLTSHSLWSGTSWSLRQNCSPTENWKPDYHFDHGAVKTKFITRQEKQARYYNQNFTTQIVIWSWPTNPRVRYTTHKLRTRCYWKTSQAAKALYHQVPPTNTVPTGTRHNCSKWPAAKPTDRNPSVPRIWDTSAGNLPRPS